MNNLEKLCRLLCSHSNQNPDELEPGNVPYQEADRDVVHVDGEVRGAPAFFWWRTYVPLARKIDALFAHDSQQQATSYQRLIAALVAQAGGELRLDDAVRDRQPMDPTIHTSRDEAARQTVIRT